MSTDQQPHQQPLREDATQQADLTAGRPIVRVRDLLTTCELMTAVAV